jgi:hypothetical protein
MPVDEAVGADCILFAAREAALVKVFGCRPVTNSDHHDGNVYAAEGPNSLAQAGGAFTKYSVGP